MRARTNLGIERNVWSWNECWNDDSSKCENCELGPHEPTLVEVYRLKGKGSEGVEIPIAVNDPGAKQNPSKVGVCEVRHFGGCRYGDQC